MDVAQMTLDFAARVAWPVLVLILGVMFRKPLSEFLREIDWVKVPGVEAKTKVSDSVRSATDALAANPESENVTDSNQDAPDEDFSPEIVTADAASGESKVFTPEFNLEDPLLQGIIYEHEGQLSDKPRGYVSSLTKNLLINNPAAAIQTSAFELGSRLIHILRMLEVNPGFGDREARASRRRRLSQDRTIALPRDILIEAHALEVLSADEFVACQDLARAVSSIDDAKGLVEVEVSTARQFARLCAAIQSKSFRRARPGIEKAAEIRAARTGSRDSGSKTTEG